MLLNSSVDFAYLGRLVSPPGLCVAKWSQLEFRGRITNADRMRGVCVATLIPVRPSLGLADFAGSWCQAGEVLCPNIHKRNLVQREFRSVQCGGPPIQFGKDRSGLSWYFQYTGAGLSEIKFASSRATGQFCAARIVCRHDAGGFLQVSLEKSSGEGERRQLARVLRSRRLEFHNAKTRLAGR